MSFWGLGNVGDQIHFVFDGTDILTPAIGKQDWIKQKEIMRSTGLFDSKGTEIFEGDILFGGVEGMSKPVEVKFQEYSFWRGMADGEHVKAKGFGVELMGYDFTWDKVEVIGNIYQNPL